MRKKKNIEIDKLEDLEYKEKEFDSECAEEEFQEEKKFVSKTEYARKKMYEEIVREAKVSKSKTDASNSYNPIEYVRWYQSLLDEHEKNKREDKQKNKRKTKK